MKNHTVVSPHLAVVDGRPVTTSLDIAEKFEKLHKEVLRAIRNVECSQEFNRRNFAPVEYLDAKGEKRPMFQITRDGFAFLAMGFTGKKAALWKERYIAAFNAMEAELLAQVNGKRADIFHHRGPVSESGLDIRYTLDLTRIVMQPTSRNLAVLERLTGIGMDDLIDELTPAAGENAATLLSLFVEERCLKTDRRIRTTLEEVWRAYLEWFKAAGRPGSLQVSRRQFSAFIGGLEGFDKLLRGGRTWVYGLVMTEVCHG